MLRISIVPALLAAFFSATLPALAQGSQAAVVRGTVTDAAGSPVSGAAVNLRGPTGYATTTDARGNFVFARVVAGTYALSVAKAGYQSAVQSGLVIESVSLRRLTIALVPATLETIASVKSATGPHFNTTPASVDVVTSQNFENQAQTQVMQVLNQIPGVQISLPGSVNGAAPGAVVVPTIRGASSYETASLIDGHPLATQSYGDYVVSYLSSFMFGSVEVVKGPGTSALEVNNAINGTINFRTKDPTATPSHDFEAGATNYGGAFANVGFSDTTLHGRLGYVFDVSVIDNPSSINGKSVLIDPSNGYLGGSLGKKLSGDATYSNIGTTESSVQTGYSLLACCYTLFGDYDNTSQLFKLRYQIAPSTFATVSYLNGQTFTDQNDNLANLTDAQFMPGSGYSGSLRAGPQQVVYLYPGAANDLVNDEPIF